jgi:hypothetical protein
MKNARNESFVQLTTALYQFWVFFSFLAHSLGIACKKKKNNKKRTKKDGAAGVNKCETALEASDQQSSE